MSPVSRRGVSGTEAAGRSAGSGATGTKTTTPNRATLLYSHPRCSGTLFAQESGNDNSDHSSGKHKQRFLLSQRKPRHTLLEQDADDDCHDDEDRKLQAKMSPPEADAKIPMNHCQTVALEKSMCPFVEPAPCKRTAHGAAV